jgi:hypothetical protein
MAETTTTTTARDAGSESVATAAATYCSGGRLAAVHWGCGGGPRAYLEPLLGHRHQRADLAARVAERDLAVPTYLGPLPLSRVRGRTRPGLRFGLPTVADEA